MIIFILVPASSLRFWIKISKGLIILIICFAIRPFSLLPLEFLLSLLLGCYPSSLFFELFLGFSSASPFFSPVSPLFLIFLIVASSFQFTYHLLRLFLWCSSLTSLLTFFFSYVLYDKYSNYLSSLCCSSLYAWLLLMMTALFCLFYLYCYLIFLIFSSFLLDIYLSYVLCTSLSLDISSLVCLRMLIYFYLISRIWLLLMLFSSIFFLICYLL